MSDQGGTAQDAEMRKSVEKLIGALENRVIENDELTQQLVEREQTIAQLHATIAQLRAELLRERVSPRRVGPIARTAGVLLMNAVVSFGAAAGGTAAAQALTHDTSPAGYAIEVPGSVGDAIRAAAEECESVARLSDAEGKRPEHRGQRLAQLVKEWMRVQGMSARALSIRSGLATSTIARITYGDLGSPKLETLEKLANGLGIPLSEILSAL